MTRMVDFDAFKDLDVQILGVSVDDPFSQQTFSESLKLPFPLLSDSDATVTHLYATELLLSAGMTPAMVPGKGMTLKKDRVIATQAFFLIDKEGILRGRWLPGIERMSSEKILKMLRRLRNKP